MAAAKPGVGRNVYIDLGANWANTLRLHEDIVRDYNLRARLRTDSEGVPRPFEVYAFEAAPHIATYGDAGDEGLETSDDGLIRSSIWNDAYCVDA